MSGISSGGSIRDIISQVNREFTAIHSKIESSIKQLEGDYSVDPVNDSIVRRTSVGTVRSNPAVHNNDAIIKSDADALVTQMLSALATEKSALQSSINTKVSTIANSSSTYKVYMQRSGSTSLLTAYSNSTTGNTLAMRDASGRLYTAAASSGNQAVNYTQFNSHKSSTANPHGVTKSQVGLGNVDNTSDATKKTNFTGSIASGNTGFVLGGDAYTALDKKLDKAGGTITGSLSIQGDLTISGMTITEGHKTLEVEDNYIVVNSNGVDISASNAGIVLRKNSTSAYGIVYNPATDEVVLGLGTYAEGDNDNSFTLDSEEGKPIVIRDGLVNGNLVQYKSSNGSITDAGKKLSDLVDLTSDQVITGCKVFSNVNDRFSNGLYIGDEPRAVGSTWSIHSLVDQLDTYTSTYINLSENAISKSVAKSTLTGTSGTGGVWGKVYTYAVDSINSYELVIPNKSGTFALTSDIPTNYVTTDTEQSIDAIKYFFRTAGFTSIYGPNVRLDRNGDEYTDFNTGYILNKNYGVNDEYILRYPDKSGVFAIVDDIPTDYVDLSSNQTINGTKLFNGYLSLMNDPVNPTDAVNLRTLESKINAVEVPVVTAGDGINVTGSTVSLDPAYLEYLSNATYSAPSIVSLSSNASGSHEVGKSVSITSITHRESNISNISGKLTLVIDGDTVSTAITPSESSASALVSKTITSTTAGSKLIVLSGTNTRGDSFSRSMSISFYYPAFYGASTATSLTSSTIQSLKSDTSITGTKSITLSTASYVYFCTTGTINKIMMDGFEVDYNAPTTVSVTRNGVTQSYKVYRTTDILEPDTYPFVIS